MSNKKAATVVNFHNENAVGPIFLATQPQITNWQQATRRDSFFIAKDNFWTAEMPTSASSLFLANFQTYENATAVDLLKQVGYQLLGKGSLDEFACGGTGLLSGHGPLFNPLNKARLVGGSSSGSAFTVAAKLVPFALAHDTGDSVRRPAAYCGVIGFKPSYGLVSRYGVIPMASSLDTVGVIAREMAVVTKVFQVIAQPDYKDLVTVTAQKLQVKTLNHKRIAVIEGIERFLSKEYRTAYLRTLELLEGEYELISVTLPSQLREKLQLSYLAICSSEIVSHLGALTGVTYGNSGTLKNTLEQRTELLGKAVKERLLIGNYFLKNEKLLLNAKKVRAQVKAWVGQVFVDCQFLLFPVTTGIAPLVSEAQKTSLNLCHWSDNLLLLANFTGNPSINIPIGIENGMPLSLNIDSVWKSDDALLAFAAKLLAKLRLVN